MALRLAQYALWPQCKTSHEAALAQAHQLVELNLSSNALTAVEGLAGLSRLEVLDLASNRLREVAGLDGLRVLHKLNLAHNRLACLAGLTALQVPEQASLHEWLSNTHLTSLAAFGAARRSEQPVGSANAPPHFASH